MEQSDLPGAVVSSEVLERTPLDPLDVEELWDRANADDAADEVHHAFARLIERAHGIGAEHG